MCLDPFPFCFRSVMSPSPCWLTTNSSTSSSFMHFLHLTNAFKMKELGNAPCYLATNSENNVWLSLSFVARFNFVNHEKMASIHEDTAQTHTKRVLKKHENKEEIHWELF